MTQMVDVREVAQWLIGSAQAGVAGTFNVMGQVCPLEDFLNTARQLVWHPGQERTVNAAWLDEH